MHPPILQQLNLCVLPAAAEIQDLQQKIGFGGNASSRLLARVKRAANVEELRLVLIAGIEQMVHLRSQQAEIERNAAEAEEVCPTRS